MFADLADRVGTTRKSNNAIEAGRMAPSTLLGLKIARALDVALEDAFGLDRALRTPADRPP